MQQQKNKTTKNKQTNKKTKQKKKKQDKTLLINFDQKYSIDFQFSEFFKTFFN